MAGFTGPLTTDFAGVQAPQCGALDACGVKGRLAQSFTDRGDVTFTGARTAQRHAGRELALADLRRELMTVFGRVAGFGALGWRSGGSVVADLRQGSEQCHDTAAAGPLELIIATNGGHRSVSTFPPDLLGAPDSATRCPGPVPSTQTIRSKALPLSLLDKRTERVAVTAASAVLTLTRVKVRMRAIRIPSGELLGGS